MPDQDATKATRWFDSFKPDPKFSHPQWCFRHWAPAVDNGANGLAAAFAMMQAILDGLAGTGLTDTPEAANTLIGGLGPLCCVLGDEIMYEIWRKCPPASAHGSRLN